MKGGDGSQQLEGAGSTERRPKGNWLRVRCERTVGRTVLRGNAAVIIVGPRHRVVSFFSCFGSLREYEINSFLIR